MRGTNTHPPPSIGNKGWDQKYAWELRGIKCHFLPSSFSKLILYLCGRSIRVGIFGH